MYKIITSSNNRSNTYLVCFKASGLDYIGVPKKMVQYLGLTSEGSNKLRVYDQFDFENGNYVPAKREFLIQYFQSKYGLDLRRKVSVDSYDKSNSYELIDEIREVFLCELGQYRTKMERDDLEVKYSISLIYAPVINEDTSIYLYYRSHGWEGEMKLSDIKKDLSSMGVPILSIKKRKNRNRFGEINETVKMILPREFESEVEKYVKVAQDLSDIELQI